LARYRVHGEKGEVSRAQRAVGRFGAVKCKVNGSIDEEAGHARRTRMGGDGPGERRDPGSGSLDFLNHYIDSLEKLNGSPGRFRRLFLNGRNPARPPGGNFALHIMNYKL
jgi:hypothetical protein